MDLQDWNPQMKTALAIYSRGGFRLIGFLIYSVSTSLPIERNLSMI